MIGMMMTTSFDYRRGYKKALLDIAHLLENHDDFYLKSKKKYKNFVTSLLRLILTNQELCDKILIYGEFGEYWFDDDKYLIVTPDGEVKIKERNSE
jgi:hypothetical protein